MATAAPTVLFSKRIRRLVVTRCVSPGITHSQNVAQKQRLIRHARQSKGIATTDVTDPPLPSAIRVGWSAQERGAKKSPSEPISDASTQVRADRAG